MTFEFKDGFGANQDVADRFARAFNPPRDKGTTNGHGRLKSTTSGAPLVADEVIIEKVRASRSAEKFEMLFDAGDVSAYDGPSEADFALLCMLRFWTQDHAQLVRLMKLSALYRPRWDERHSARQTRLEYTVERALSGDFETHEWSAHKSLSSSHDTLRGFVDDDNVQVKHSERGDGLQVVFFRDLGEPKSREFVIETVAPKGYPVVAYGAGGVAKSFAVLTAGILIAGKDALADPRWLGYRVLKHGHVLYVDFELDVEEQHRRVRDLCNGLGMPIPSRLAYLSGVGHRPEAVFRKAGEFCEKYGAVATILDSVGLAADGDMDKGRDTLAFHRRYVNALRRAGTTPFLVDHEGKLQAGEKRGAKSIIGSIYKSASARSVLHFMKEDYDSKTRELSVRVSHTKANFSEEVQPFGVRFAFGRDRVTQTPYDLSDVEMVDEKSVPVRQRILTALGDEPLTIRGIVAATDDGTGSPTSGTVRNYLAEFCESGLVEHDDRKPRTYWLTSSTSSDSSGDSCDDDDLPGNPDHDPNQTTIDEQVREASEASDDAEEF